MTDESPASPAPPPAPLIYNNSGLVNAEMCWRLYYFNEVRRLGLKFEQSLPGFSARFEGVLWHAILAEHYSGGTHFGTGISALIDDAYKDSYAAAEYDEEFQAINERKQYFHNLYEAYEGRYRETDKDWEVLGVEEQLITPTRLHCKTCNYSFDLLDVEIKPPNCPGCLRPIPYFVAQLDLRIREFNVEKIVDHKTKNSSVSEFYLQGFSESPQFTHYLWVASKVYDRDIHSGIVNVTAKLKLITKKGNPFHRHSEIIRSPEDFAEWYSERMALIESIEGRIESHSTDAVAVPDAVPSWPRNAASCRRFGLCEYHGLCWPSRPQWWTIPYDLEDSFEVKEQIHTDNYKLLLQEKI